MATSMHRLQISLPRWQARFLAERARRDGVSVAEVVRTLIAREAEATTQATSTDSIWEISGLAEDAGHLLAGIPVSENPDLYLTADLGPTQASIDRGKIPYLR